MHYVQQRAGEHAATTQEFKTTRVHDATSNNIIIIYTHNVNADSVAARIILRMVKSARIIFIAGLKPHERSAYQCCVRRRSIVFITDENRR